MKSNDLTRYDRGYMNASETENWWKGYWDADNAWGNLAWVDGVEQPPSPQIQTALAKKQSLGDLGIGSGRQWIAVRSNDAADVINAMGCHAIEQVAWTSDPEPIKNTWKDWWVVTPPCGGTVFIGTAGWNVVTDNLTDFMNDTQDLAPLSQTVSPVFYFYQNGFCQHYAFAHWKDGKLRRAVLTTQTRFDEFGKPLNDEPAPVLRPSFEDLTLKRGQTMCDGISLYEFGENQLQELANNWIANPRSIPPKQEGEEPECWTIMPPRWSRLNR